MATDNLRARLRSSLGSGPARDELLSAMGSTPFGNVFYVAGSSATMGSSDKNEGLSSDAPLATMAQVMTNINSLPTRLKSNGTIVVSGDIRGTATTPLGAYGWKIISGAGGRPHHTTSSGVVLPGNGATWREAATAEGAPLLVLREQGWEVHNIMMLPQATYSAVKLHCEETAAAPDGSHAIFSGVRFFDAAQDQTGFGIEDYGGSAQIGVYGCSFRGLDKAFYQSNVSIRNPQDHEWHGNWFIGCKTDIAGNFDRSDFYRNVHRTVYHGTTHPTTLNLALTGGNGGNIVREVYFADNLADVTIAKGYKPGTGDVWRTFASDTAAYDVTVPS